MRFLRTLRLRVGRLLPSGQRSKLRETALRFAISCTNRPKDVHKFLEMECNLAQTAYNLPNVAIPFPYLANIIWSEIGAATIAKRLMRTLRAIEQCDAAIRERSRRWQLDFPLMPYISSIIGTSKHRNTNVPSKIDT
jgi:hypothetical protein